MPPRTKRSSTANTNQSRIKRQIVIICAVFAALYLITTPSDDEEIASPDSSSSSSLRGSNIMIEHNQHSEPNPLPEQPSPLPPITNNEETQGFPPIESNRVYPDVVDDGEEEEEEDSNDDDLEEQLDATISEAKLDVEEAENTDISKSEKILEESVRAANSGMKTFLESFLSNFGISVSKVKEVEDEVASRLEDEVQEKLFTSAEAIAEEKKEEIDVVVTEDRNTFRPEEIEGDVNLMETFFVEDMKMEINEVREKIQTDIPNLLQKIQKDVVKEKLGIEMGQNKEEQTNVKTDEDAGSSGGLNIKQVTDDKEETNTPSGKKGGKTTEEVSEGETDHDQHQTDETATVEEFSENKEGVEDNTKNEPAEEKTEVELQRIDEEDAPEVDDLDEDDDKVDEDDDDDDDDDEDE